MDKRPPSPEYMVRVCCDHSLPDSLGEMCSSSLNPSALGLHLPCCCGRARALIADGPGF